MGLQITLTPNELIDYGLWDKYCELTGVDIWAVNEGRMDSQDKLILSASRLKEMGASWLLERLAGEE